MRVAAISQPLRAELRTPVIWGLVIGVAQAATPLPFWWLDTATVYALGLVVIAWVYIGFAQGLPHAGRGRPNLEGSRGPVNPSGITVNSDGVHASPGGGLVTHRRACPRHLTATPPN